LRFQQLQFDRATTLSPGHQSSGNYFRIVQNDSVARLQKVGDLGKTVVAARSSFAIEP
jgi:hypothetical protein